MWTPSSPLSCNFCRLRDDFDDDGQLDSIAPKARSNPTARRRRNHLEVCKSCMTKVTRVSTLSMGQSSSLLDVCYSALRATQCLLQVPTACVAVYRKISKTFSLQISINSSFRQITEQWNIHFKQFARIDEAESIRPFCIVVFQHEWRSNCNDAEGCPMSHSAVFDQCYRTRRLWLESFNLRTIVMRERNDVKINRLRAWHVGQFISISINDRRFRQ